MTSFLTAFVLSKKGPIYKQLAQYIQENIEAGVIPQGYVFPTFREMEQFFNVSRNSLGGAFELLRCKGCVVKTHEKSYTVADSYGSAGTPGAVAAGWHRYINNNDAADAGYEKFLFNMENRVCHREQGETVISSEFGFRDVYINTLNRVNAGIRGFLSSTCSEKYPELIEHVRIHLRSLGINASASQIMLVSSYRTGLYFIYMRLLNASATLFAANPSIARLSPQIRASRARMAELKTDSKGIILSDFIEQVENTRHSVVYMESLCTWPAGAAIDPERANAVAEYCQAHSIPVIEGDGQRELWFGCRPHNPLKASDDGGNILYISSFLSELCPTESLSFIVGPGYLIEEMSMVYNNIAVNSKMALLAMLDLIGSGSYAAYMNKFIPELRGRMGDVIRLLEIHLKQHAAWEMPSGGVYVVVTFNCEIDFSKLNTSGAVLWFPLIYFGEACKNSLAITVTSCSLADIEAFIVRLSTEVKTFLTLNGEQIRI